MNCGSDGAFLAMKVKISQIGDSVDEKVYYECRVLIEGPRQVILLCGRDDRRGLQ